MRARRFILLLPRLVALAASLPMPAAGAAQNCPQGYEQAWDASYFRMTGKKLQRDDPKVRSFVASLGTPAVEGGVPHTLPRDQCRANICWSYTLNGLAESEKLRADGVVTHLSPEYLQFYNIYFALAKNIAYFRSLAKLLEKPAGRAALEADRRDIRTFYNVGSPQRNSPVRGSVPTGFFIPSLGAFNKGALKLAEKTGLVPLKQLDAPIRTDLDERDLERAMRNFIGKNMLSSANLERYGQPGHDGINTNLFQDLAAYLKPYIGPAPLRPNDPFTYRGKKVTPLTFMHDYMHFDPNSYASFLVNPESSDQALKAIAASIDRGVPVPIGFQVFKDKISKEGMTHFGASGRSGVFTASYCPGGLCTQPEGGHATLTVNYLKDGAANSSPIFKNSWGEKMGLDANGGLPTTKKGGGYDIMAPDYAKRAMNEFVLKKSVANEAGMDASFQPFPYGEQAPDQPPPFEGMDLEKP